MTKRSRKISCAALLALALSIPAVAAPADRGRDPEGPATRILRTILHVIVGSLDEMSIPH